MIRLLKNTKINPSWNSSQNLAFSLPPTNTHQYRITTKNSLVRKRLVYVRRRKFNLANEERILTGRKPMITFENLFKGNLKDERKLLYASRKILCEFYGFHAGYRLKKYYNKIVKGNKRYRPQMHLRFLDMLERRLDVFCFKVGYFKSIPEARHYIRRGVVNINDAPMRRCSYGLNDDDYISLNFTKSFTYPEVLNRIKERLRPVPNGMPDSHHLLNYMPSQHIRKWHFDFNYTTLTAYYRHSAYSESDLQDGGSVFKNNSLMRILQLYWWSYRCK